MQFQPHSSWKQTLPQAGYAPAICFKAVAVGTGCGPQGPKLSTHLYVQHVVLGLVLRLKLLRLHDNQLPWGHLQELSNFSVESMVEFVIFSQVVSWRVNREVKCSLFKQL